MGILQYFSAIFIKGDNFSDFLLISLDNASLTKWGLSERKQFAPRGANSFLSELTLTEKEAKMKMAELFPLKEYPYTSTAIKHLAAH